MFLKAKVERPVNIFSVRFWTCHERVTAMFPSPERTLHYYYLSPVLALYGRCLGDRYNLFLRIIGLHFKSKYLGLPWWRSGWESACQCWGHGFEPWSGKIPPAAEQLGPWATTTEPARLEPVLRNKRGRDSERPAHRDEEWPPRSPQPEKNPRTETKTQHSQK